MGSSWHHWELEQVFKELQSQPTGISYGVARRRLRKNKPKSVVFWVLVLVTAGGLLFPLTRSLIVSRIGILTIGVLVLQAIIFRGLQLAKLAQDEKLHRAIVKRDQQYIVIPSRSVVEGDLICLQPGYEIEADVRLVVLQDLVVAREDDCKWQMQRKDTTAPLPLNVNRSEHSNMVYAGSLVAEGEAMGVVVKTYKYPRQFAILEHFSVFYFLFASWCGLGLFLIWFSLPTWSLTIVYFLFVLSVPLHWLGMFKFLLIQGAKKLQAENILLRSPFLLWTLSRVDQIVLDLNSYANARPDLGVGWHGLWHGEKRDDITVLNFMPGLALPICQSLALVSDTAAHRELFTKVDVAITSTNSDSVMQRYSGVILDRPDLSLLEQIIRQSRVTIDRWRRILFFSLVSGLSWSCLLILGRVFTLLPLTPLQVIWSGIVIPTSLVLLFLIEPMPQSLPPQRSNLLDLVWLRNLSLSVVLIVAAPIVIVRFASVSLAWSVFNFSILALGCSLLRVRLLQFYQWIVAVFIFVIFQVVWVQTARSGMSPLDVGSWLIAVVIASSVFWLNELLRLH